MTWLALSVALAASQPPPVAAPWRIYASDRVHVGVRPAALVSPDELAIGITLQISRKGNP